MRIYIYTHEALQLPFLVRFKLPFLFSEENATFFIFLLKYETRCGHSGVIATRANTRQKFHPEC